MAPTRPTVVSYDDVDTDNADESSTALKVIWHSPDNAGRPSYHTATRLSTRRAPHTELCTDLTVEHQYSYEDEAATITELEADTSYDVRVRANNGDGRWPVVAGGDRLDQQGE